MVSLHARYSHQRYYSGSCPHNFINIDVALDVGLPVSMTGGLNIKVANGDKVSCAGRVPAVTINVVKEAFNTDSYAILLDAILSVAFPHTLRPILLDFNELCLAFRHAGRNVLWQWLGSPSTEHKTCPLRQYLVKPQI